MKILNWKVQDYIMSQKRHIKFKVEINDKKYNVSLWMIYIFQ